MFGPFEVDPALQFMGQCRNDLRGFGFAVLGYQSVHRNIPVFDIHVPHLQFEQFAGPDESEIEKPGKEVHAGFVL
jgi:hypothetical protein